MPEQSTNQHLKLFPTPDIRNVRVVEVRDSTLNRNAYPAAIGSPHPYPALFPNHRLTFQGPIENKPGWIKQVYACDYQGQDAYNYEITFSGQSNSHPIYARAYLYLRAGYAPLAKETPDPDFPGPGNICLLVEEDMRDCEDAEIRSRYVLVVRAYETLPGPWLPFTRYDDNLGPVQGRRRAVLNTGQEASLTLTTKTTYEAREGSSVVSWEIEEIWSDGTGGSGNPAYPIGVTDFYDVERGAVEITTQLVPKTGSEAGTLVNNAGVITETKYEPFNEFLLRRSVEVWTPANAPVLETSGYDDNRGPVQKSAQLIIAAGTEEGSLIIDAGIVTQTSYEAVNDLIVRRSVEVWTPANAPVLETDVYDDNRGAVQKSTRLIIATGTEEGSLIIDAGIVTQTSYEAVNDLIVRRSVDTWELPGPALVSVGVNEDGSTSVVTRTLKDLSSITEGEVFASGTLTITTSENFQEPVAWEVSSARAIPGPVTHSVAFLNGEETFPQITTEQTVATAATYTPGEAGVATCPVSGYSSLLLVEQALEATARASLRVDKRVYEILPGPWLPFTRYDDNLGPVQGRRRAVLNTGQSASLTATKKISYEARESSAVVLWEIEEIYSDGSGDPGNPVFPTEVQDIYDPQLGPVQRTTQLVPKTGSEVGGINVAGVTFTETEYEPYNEFLLRRIVEVSTLPGPSRSGQNYDPQLDISFDFTKQVMTASEAEGETQADVDPLDALRAEVTKIAMDTAHDRLDELHFTFAGQERVDLPDKLISAIMLWSNATGVGSSTHGQGGTPTTSTTVTIGSSHQSSNSTAGNLSYEISHGFSDEIPSVIHIFYLPLANVTTAAILAKIGASVWPTVRAKSHRVSFSGGSESKRNAESKTYAFGWNGFTYVPVIVGSSTSEDYDVSSSAGAETIPPTIHPALTITNAGSAIPSVLSATSPAVFPTGTFLRRSDARPFQYGYAQVTAVTVVITAEHVNG